MATRRLHELVNKIDLYSASHQAEFEQVDLDGLWMAGQEDHADDKHEELVDSKEVAGPGGLVENEGEEEAEPVGAVGMQVASVC